MNIRDAAPADAPAIARVLQSAFPPRTIELFIYGCAGIDRYIAAQIEAWPKGGDTAFTVAESDGAVAGFVELRVLPDRLFVNYIALADGARSSGLGPRLLEAAIARTRRPHHARMGLDVLADNTGARRWYDALGFSEDSRTEWWRLPLPASSAEPAQVIGLPQAAALQAAYGFSRVTVAGHDIGLLGERWFRITDARVLSEGAAIAALRRLDPAREVLALVPPDTISAGDRVAITHRMSAALDALGSALQRRSTR